MSNFDENNKIKSLHSPKSYDISISDFNTDSSDLKKQSILYEAEREHKPNQLWVTEIEQCTNYDIPEISIKQEIKEEDIDVVECELNGLKCKYEIDQCTNYNTSELSIKQEIKEKDIGVLESELECKYEIDPRRDYNNHKNVIKNFKQNRKTSQKKKKYFEQNENVNKFFIKCKLCDFKCKSLSLFNAHKGNHPNSKGIKLYQCEECNRSSTVKNAKMHFLIYHKPLEEIEWFQCDQCEFKTKLARYLRQHKNIHRKANNENKWFKCQECNYIAKSKSVLTKHQVNKHTNKADDEVEWYKCKDCNYKTKWKSALRKHQIHKHKADDELKWFKCEECNHKTKLKSLLTRHQINKHKTDEQVKWFYCYHCEYKAKQKSHLKMHSLLHLPQKDIIKCDLCDFTTKFEHYLNIHKRNMHSSDKKKVFACNQCDFITKYKKNILKHQRSVHKSILDTNVINMSSIQNEATALQKI